MSWPEEELLWWRAFHSIDEDPTKPIISEEDAIASFKKAMS